MERIYKTFTGRELPVEGEFQKPGSHLRIQFCGEMGKPDKMGDIFEPGCYVANDHVAMCGWNHNRQTPIGVGRIEPYGENLMAWDGEVLDETSLKVIRAMEGDQEYSYAFNPIDYEVMKSGGFRFKKVEVYEVSPVLQAASYGTHTISNREYEAEWRKSLRDAKEPAAEPETPVVRKSLDISNPQHLAALAAIEAVKAEVR